MTRRLVSFLVFGCLAIWAQRPAPARKIEIREFAPSTVQQRDRVQRLLAPGAKEKISRVAAAFSERARKLPPSTDFQALAVSDVRTAFPGNRPQQDIDTLVFMVLMQASQDGQSDLKNLMAATQATAQQKERLRAGQEKKEKDAANELSEMESLRLQMYMDRESKLLATLSNVEKKISDTQDQMIQNLK
jgi:hypothetical protein